MRNARGSSDSNSGIATTNRDRQITTHASGSGTTGRLVTDRAVTGRMVIARATRGHHGAIARMAEATVRSNRNRRSGATTDRAATDHLEARLAATGHSAIAGAIHGRRGAIVRPGATGHSGPNHRSRATTDRIATGRSRNGRVATGLSGTGRVMTDLSGTGPETIVHVATGLAMTGPVAIVRPVIVHRVAATVPGNRKATRDGSLAVLAASPEAPADREDRMAHAVPSAVDDLAHRSLRAEAWTYRGSG